MATIANLDRFQAQPRWGVSDDSCKRDLVVKSKMCVFVAVLLMAATAHAWAEVASDGLVVYYRADNADGAGNPGSGELATWTDLALEFGEANNGKLHHSIGMQQKLKFKPGSGWVENTDQPKDSPFRYGLEFEATRGGSMWALARDAAYVTVTPPSFVEEDSFTYELWLRVDTIEEAHEPIGYHLIGEYSEIRKEFRSMLGGSLSGKLWLGHYPCRSSASRSDPRAYGLYLIDEEGNHEPIYRDPEISCWRPYPLRTRKTPPALPSTGDPELAKKNLALCMVQDVYHGMEGVERGTVKHLRIMEQVPRPWAARRFWDPRDQYGSHVRLVSERTVLGLKVLRGVVPVHADGSALFYVPADKNICFEALDESYMELQRERTYVNYRPGEVRSCVGCHETPKDSLPKRNIMTMAQKMPPSMPAPQPGDQSACRPIDYITDVQPVLEKHCVRCHGARNPQGKLDLTGDLTTMSCRSYESIMGRGGLVKSFDEHSSWGGAAYSKPKSVGSCASRFISQVRNGCPGNDEKLPLADFVKLTTWVDANAQYFGTYYGRKNIRYKDHPNFRPVPTFAEATSTVCPVPMEKR